MLHLLWHLLLYYYLHSQSWLTSIRKEGIYAGELTANKFGVSFASLRCLELNTCKAAGAVLFITNTGSLMCATSHKMSYHHGPWSMYTAAAVHSFILFSVRRGILKCLNYKGRMKMYLSASTCLLPCVPFAHLHNLTGLLFWIFAEFMFCFISYQFRTSFHFLEWEANKFFFLFSFFCTENIVFCWDVHPFTAVLG